MSKNLKVIQTIVSIAKIVCLVLMICSIVAAALCALGLVCYASGITDSVDLGDVTIKGIVVDLGELNNSQVYMAFCAALVSCAAGAVALSFAVKYCKNELAAGTPFTAEGAKEMRRLGILTLAINVGSSIVVSIVCSIIAALSSTEFSTTIGGEISLTSGLLFIALSYVFAYGAELANGNNEVTETENAEEK